MTGEREPALVSAGVERRRRWTAGFVLLGTTLVSFQGGLLRVAYPSIRADLNASIPAMEVVSVAGLVVTIATVVIFGRLADLVGPRRIYSTGLAAFAAGGAASALAPRVGLLAVAQAAQGLAWSMAVASSMPLLVQAFPAEMRGRVVAANHMAVAVGLAMGPGLGGLVVEHLGWRLALGSVVPMAILLGLLVGRMLPVDAPAGPRPHFDLAGSAALAVALGALLVLIDRGGHGALRPVALATLAVVVLGAFVAFLVIESRSPAPTVELGLFRSMAFSAGLAASFLNFIAMASNMFLMPFFLQEALGMSAGRAGTVMMAMPMGVLVAAPVAGRMADRLGSRLPATMGMAVITATIGLMATFTDGVSVPEVAAVLFVYGLGAGLFQSPNISGVLAAARGGRLGVASGTLSTVGRLGQVVGVAVAGGIWDRGTEGASDGGAAGFHAAFVVLALFGVLATAASWARGRLPARRATAATADLAHHAG